MTTDITVHLDEDPTVREEGFFEAKVSELAERIAVLEFDNAELAKSNKELKERVEKLASRQPTWPKGYRPHKNNPHKNNRFHKSSHNRKFSNNGKGDITR